MARRLPLATLATIALALSACAPADAAERPASTTLTLKPPTAKAPSSPASKPAPTVVPTVVPTAAPTTAPIAPTPTVPTPTGNAATGEFRIVGNDIVDPAGKIFYPIGANIAVKQGQYETGYTFNWRGTGTGRSEDVLAWGWNTVRPTMICNPPSSGTPTEAEINAGIDAFIDEYTAKKIVVMIECHDVTGANPTTSHAKMAGIYRFMERLATKYADNPYVWFNVVNEPFEGGSATEVEQWMTLQRDALARIRARAPRNIFVADIPVFGQGVETFVGPNSVTRLGTGQCNVLYGWHAYGALGKNGTFGSFADYADRTRSRANHAAALKYIVDNDIPVVIGEFGDPLTLDEGTAGLPIWNRIGAEAVMDYAPAAGVGLLWWHATGDSGIFLTYSLTNDRSAPWAAARTGAGLSTSGRKFWEISQNKPGGQPFVGDIGQSNC